MEDTGDAAQREQPGAALVNAYRDALARNDEEAIRASLRNATSAGVMRRLWQALDQAIHAPPAADAVLLRIFALPVLLITGGRAGATLPGALPDASRVKQVLEAGAALGPARNFGFGNALCTIESLQSVAFSRLYRLQRAAAAEAADMLDLPPAQVHTRSNDEEVHLRFLAGAGVTPAGAPSFLETASAIGTWGMALTHELAGQLRVDGLSVLPIPRPPATLLAAQLAGAVAREELALQAFVSRVVRRFRSEAGEPQATLAALSSGALGLRLDSPFIEDRVSVHRRALHPVEEVEEAGQAVQALLRECAVSQVSMLPEVVDDALFASAAALRLH
jgi:hypothetical protein